jgi:periplasmic divalent cation tolerance protein
MNNSWEYIVVLITTTDIDEAKRIADLVIRHKLAACVNIIDTVESLFWWKGEVTHEKESLLIIKTMKYCLDDLITEVKKIHKYTVPEIIALPIVLGEINYLNWIKDSVKK